MSTEDAQRPAAQSAPIALIAGTGFAQLSGLSIDSHQQLQTPFGQPSSPVALGQWHRQAVLFLNRHGEGHHLPPHRINYRANLMALKDLGAREVIAINSVGSLNEQMPPGTLVLPDDLIDYTHGREHTFAEALSSLEAHVDMSEPYGRSLRERLMAADPTGRLPAHAVYGATNGPRLETPAEIRRLERDGCDLVGMTGMPEASLARELNLEYACIAVVVNWAAGFRGNTAITTDEIRQHIQDAEQTLLALLDQFMKDTR